MVTLSTQSPSAPLPSNNPASSTPPSRSARRRGLSYLRSYTHSHLSSSSHQNSNSSAGPSSLPRHSIFRSSSCPSSEQAAEPDSSSTGKPNESGQERLSRLINLDQSSASAASDSATGQVAVNTALVGISRLMARNRTGSSSRSVRREVESAPSNLAGYPQDQMPTIRLIPHQDPRAARPSLAFPPTSRTLPHEDCVIRVGRYSERDSNPNPPPNTPSSAPVGFKSKVVSRRHCEFWCSNGQWYIKDVKSSSGTFLNHIRLSQPSVESRPWPVNDGDVVQLGIDFRGGEEMIFRCVKIRVECNRAWQKSLNSFNVSTHKQLRNLGKAPKKDTDAASTHSAGTECSICLMSIAPCQSLFVAPCSHVWHYKCIRPILNDHKTWPSFLCPNCRAVTDLEADVDDPDDGEWEDDENGDDEHRNEIIAPVINDANKEHELPATGPQDKSPANPPTRILSIINSSDSSPARPPNDPPSPASADQQPLPTSSHVPSNSSPSSSANRLNASTSSSIIDRRIASRMTTLQQSSEDLSSRSKPDETPRRASNYANRLRPITPTEPILQEDLTPDGSPSALTTGADLSSDGPMTPTNNAGPFVFDGSAGRAAGRSTVAGLVHETESAA
ncbi:hypothetical protein MMC07_002131 [Pseudocyphellaria aurata]|nr:hypothetical protein [Pseudocyphellaria aurata]